MHVVLFCASEHTPLQMDKDGCVPLDVIARFNRVRALTQDVGMIKEVCWRFKCTLKMICSFPPVTSLQQEGGDCCRRCEA